LPKPREELRRGLRDLIERASHEMEALGDPSSGGVAPGEAPHGAASRGPAPDAVVVERAGADDVAPASRSGAASDTVSGASTPDPGNRPMLKLVRNTVRTLIGAREAPAAEQPADQQPAAALTPAIEAAPADATAKTGVAPLPVAPPLSPEPTLEPTGAPLMPQTLDVEVLHGGVHPRRGVCESYYINHACWEVPDAFCNHALHTCMLRDCPVYRLHREELERRFASKYSHLW